jgi:hypothetical protein
MKSMRWLPAVSAQELLKLFDGQPCIDDEPTHCVGVDRIVARDGDDTNPIGHHNMLALADYAETGFLEGSHSLKMINTCKLRHA